MPAFASDRLLSAWKLNSGDVFLASLRDAELATERYISQEGLLPDPPLQANDLQSELYGELNTEDDSGQQDPSVCKTRAPGTEGSLQERPCPAKNGPSLDVNTVEVVKRDGQYHLVMDGVSYGALNPGENRFWIPRFKESSIELEGSSAKRRVVQPVLFSMRIEAFEALPSACFVEARQRVVNDGTLYMEDNVIKTNEMKPYQTSSMSAGVTILPYPLICTPPPYVTINDYSKVLDRELALKLHYMDDATRKTIDTAFQTLLGASAVGAAASAASSVASAVGTISGAVSTLSGAAYSLLKLGISVASGAGSTSAVATGAATLAAGVVPVVGSAVATGAAYLLWEYLRKGTIKYEPKELTSVQSALSSSLNRGPKVYRITIDKLTSMIYRIAETRANGSVMSKSDNTLGMSIHDFQHHGWNEEAAFMQWLMYGNGTREGRDPVTGLFSEESNSKHAGLYASSSAVDAAATMNTVGLQGLDGLSLSNCRTEFSYAIKIKEPDGSDGPTVVLNSTRINGLDAGWLASGFNDQFRECRRAANCLRSRLARLPGVSRYMASRGTMVSDTNNGAILSDDLTDTQRLLLGRELEDAAGVATKREDLEKRLDKAMARRDKADRRQAKHANYVERQRKRVKKAEAKLAEQKRAAAPNATRIRTAEKRLASQKRNLEEAKQRQELYADEAAYRQSRQAKIEDIANRGGRRFVNIFDYEEVHYRIVKELLGGPLFGGGSNDEDEDDSARVYEDDFDAQFEIDANYDLDTDDEDDGLLADQRTTRTFWQEVVSGESGDVQPATAQQHIKRSLIALADSMSVDDGEIATNDDNFIRFMRFLCPLSSDPNADSMRFAAFIVPRSAARFRRDLPGNPTVTRIMPHILSFQSGLISTFGKVTIMQPTAVSDKTFIMQDDASLAAKTIAQARVALRSMTAVFPRLLKDMRIYDITGHLCQIYKLKTDQSIVSEIFNRPIARESTAADFLSLSFVPGTSTLEAMLRADKAGGNFLGMMARIASGQKLAGVAKLVSDAGLSVEVSSFIAAASFSEIVAYHLVEHGVVVDDKVGFELQRIELVRSAVFNARYSSQVIGQFLSDNYSGSSSKTKAISYDDVCFHCIPGLSHLRIALRRLGIFSSFDSSTSMELCHRVGKALYRLGSSQRSTLEGFPFVCLQSAVASVPKSVRFVEGYASPIDIHVKLCALSYERVLLGAAFCATDPRANACLCTDVVYTRPSVLKQFYLRPLEATRVASESKNAKAQSKWQPPQPSMGMRALKYRAAKLRLDIHDEYKNESAASELSVMNDELNMISQMDLVKKMNALDVRDFASIDVYGPVANFMVPFGMTDIGTVRDIIHSKFEQQPVWIQEVEASAASVIVSSGSTPDVVARSAKLDEHGRPNHPLVLKMKVKAAELVLFANKKIGSDKFDVVPPGMESKVLSLPSMCKYINYDNSITGVSGRLTEHYRTSMHNAERLFQLVVLVSSGVADPGPAENLTIELDLEDADSYHMPAFVACACIANALAKSIVGSSCMVVTKDGGRGEVEACAKIRRMCQGMLLAGIKAVPFCEICAITSLL